MDDVITQTTAEQIWSCYREIRCAEGLLSDMEELSKLTGARFNEHAEKLKDAFGRGQDLQLGIPQGKGQHRLFGVRPRLAESIIRAHIADQRARLIEANEQARIELTTDH